MEDLKKERGIDSYKRHVEERKAKFQAAKRARLEASATHLATTSGGNNISNDEDIQATEAAEGGGGRSKEEAAEVKDEDLNFVPDGWFNCPPCGEPIGMFIPSKVPLSPAYNDSIPQDKRYTPRDIVEGQKALGRQIGLVINLTSSNIYYRVKQFEELEVEVTQIQCQGKGEAPTPEQVNSFFYTASRYCIESQNKKYILVHCTHGFNRTGYMICNLLMRSPLTFGRYLTVREVVEQFANARPPGIFKPLYLDQLFKYYHESKLDFSFPALPSWKKGLDDEDIEEDVGGLEGREEGREIGGGGEDMQHDDLLGEAITAHHQLDIQNLVRSKILDPTSLGHVYQFPGSQPVSFSRENMHFLEHKRYYVTWKADGTRYMLLAMQDGVYLISRSFEVRRLQMRLPLWGLSKDKKPSFKFLPQNGTLLDGEMVVDEDAGTGEKKRRFYAYDLMSMDGKKLTDLPFKQRYAYIEDFILSPRKLEQVAMAREKGAYPYHMYKYEEECFKMRRKSFYPLHASEAVLTNLIPKLLHESDGLIFQDWEERYEPLTCPSLLKWKYSHLNSVDFLLQSQGKGEENESSLYVQSGGRPWLLEGAKVMFPDHVDPLDYDSKIIECSSSPEFVESQTWIFMRGRVDKDTPNDIKVYRKVVDSIKDNIDDDEIVQYTKKAAKNALYDRDRNRKINI